MNRRKRQSHREPIIALINIIFLILIFFMVAGSLSGRPDGGIEFVNAGAEACCRPDGALVVLEDGSLLSGGVPIASLQAYLGQLEGKAPLVRIAPDRRLPANKLLTLARQLRDAGAGRIVIVVEARS